MSNYPQPDGEPSPGGVGMEVIFILIGFVVMAGACLAFAWAVMEMIK
jgi:hypothetical protein